ncbi:MAG: class IV adenylate cyclase [Eubacteriales bacterium]|nr:class IV adenylate cyclase [Eubacteriales bacterium]
MIEVEVKLPIHRRRTIEKGLLALGFKPGFLIRESDLYFNGGGHDFMRSDEALRIRESENLSTASSSAFLTYKGPKLDAVSSTRKELETKLENADAGRQILSALGYQSLAPVEKLRQYYHREDMTACVDQVEHLGSFLELEILVEDESQREHALKKIEALLLDLDCRMEDTTRYSYLFMLQHHPTC